MEEVLILDSHYLEVSKFNERHESVDHTLWENCFERVFGAVVRDKDSCGVVEEVVKVQ